MCEIVNNKRDSIKIIYKQWKDVLINQKLTVIDWVPLWCQVLLSSTMPSVLVEFVMWCGMNVFLLSPRLQIPDFLPGSNGTKLCLKGCKMAHKYLRTTIICFPPPLWDHGNQVLTILKPLGRHKQSPWVNCPSRTLELLPRKIWKSIVWIC